MCKCPTCGRSFNEKSMIKHAKVCEKVCVCVRVCVCACVCARVRAFCSVWGCTNVLLKCWHTHVNARPPYARCSCARAHTYTHTHTHTRQVFATKRKPMDISKMRNEGTDNAKFVQVCAPPCPCVCIHGPGPCMRTCVYTCIRTYTHACACTRTSLALRGVRVRMCECVCACARAQTPRTNLPRSRLSFGVVGAFL